jgi:hypothetical protein
LNPFYAAPFTLAAGTHTVSFFSYDQAQNDEYLNQVAVTVGHDALPPRTALAINEASPSSGTIYVNDTADFNMTAIDDGSTVGDGLGGATQSFLSIDSAAFSAYTGDFRMNVEGAHSLSFYSVDTAGNAESAHTSAITVDTTPPVTTFQLFGASTTVGGVLNISTDTSFVLSSVDPVSGGVASGIDTIYYVVDQDPLSCDDGPAVSSAPAGTCDNQTYQGAFNISLGTHTVYFLSDDNAGNQENVNSVLVNVQAAPLDLLPPRTRLFAGEPSFSTGTLYATDITTFALTAVDDAASIGDSAGKGVALTEIAIDTTIFSTYAGTFSFVAEGLHSVSYYSADVVDHVEPPHTTGVAIDLTPPQTQLQVLGSSMTDTRIGPVFSTTTLLSLTAFDPVSNGVASGVGDTLYVIDINPFDCPPGDPQPDQPSGTCANQTYNGPFVLSIGTHTVYYLSEDNVGNQETLHADTFTVRALPFDSLPPRTALVSGTMSLSSGSVYVNAATTFSLSAVDDLAAIGDGAGLGVAQTLVALDNGAFALYSGSFSFALEGAHAVSFYSVDWAEHIESTKTVGVDIDLTPPVSELALTGPQGVDAFGRQLVSTATVLSLTGLDPPSAGVASGLAVISYSLDSSPAVVYAGAFTVSSGSHTLTFSAKDNAGNQEALHTVALASFADDLPPRSALAFGGPSYSSSTLYVTAVTNFGLTAVDDLNFVGDAAGAGLAGILIAVDTSAFSVYSGTFSLAAEGLHTLAYESADLLGDVEAAHTLSVAVDLTPPQTALQVQGSSSTDTQGRVIVSSTTPLSLSAFDPLSHGVASGLASITYALDAGTAAAYAAPFTLSLGTHTVSFFAADNVGNVESIHTVALNVLSDFLPPRTSLVAGTPSFSSSTLFAAELTTFTLATVDDQNVIGDGAGVGVSTTYISLDGAPFTVYASTFALAPGRHSVSFYSVDQAGHAESPRGVPVVVDDTAPGISLQVQGSSATDANARLTVSSSSLLSLPASDPLVAGFASGVRAVIYGVDVDPRTCPNATPDPGQTPGTCADLAYAGPFSLALGTHTVYFPAIDNVGNRSILRAVPVAVRTPPFDVLPPRTLLAFGGPVYSTAALSTLFATDVATFVFTSADDAVVVGDGAGLGVTQTFFAVDAGDFAPYAAPFSLSGEGTHTIKFYSVDAVGNVEVRQSSSVVIDLTAPVTQLGLSGANELDGYGGIVVIASSTVMSLSSADPLSNGVDSGVAEIDYAIDGASTQVYNGTFTFTTGAHILSFAAVDKVGNRESVQFGGGYRSAHRRHHLVRERFDAHRARFHPGNSRRRSRAQVHSDLGPRPQQQHLVEFRQVAVDGSQSRQRLQPGVRRPSVDRDLEHRRRQLRRRSEFRCIRRAADSRPRLRALHSSLRLLRQREVPSHFLVHVGGRAAAHAAVDDRRS